jgi:hypothetical protein
VWSLSILPKTLLIPIATMRARLPKKRSERTTLRFTHDSHWHSSMPSSRGASKWTSTHPTTMRPVHAGTADPTAMPLTVYDPLHGRVRPGFQELRRAREQGAERASGGVDAERGGRVYTGGLDGTGRCIGVARVVEM